MARIPQYIAQAPIPETIPTPHADSGVILGAMRVGEENTARLGQQAQYSLSSTADFFMRQQAAKDAADVHLLHALSIEKLDEATDAIRRAPDYTTHLTRWQEAFKGIQADALEKAPNDAVKNGVQSRLLTLYIQRVKHEREFQGGLFKDQSRAQLNATVEKFLLAGERDPLLGKVPGQEEVWLAEAAGPLSDAVATGVISAQEREQHLENARKRLIGGWADREMLARPVQTMVDAEQGTGLFENAGAEQRREVAGRARAEWRRQEEELRHASAEAEREQKKRHGDNFAMFFSKIQDGQDVMREAMTLASQRELDPDKLESLRKMQADQRAGKWEDDVNVRSTLERKVEMGRASLEEIYAAVRPGGISAQTATSFANIVRAERHRAEDKSLSLVQRDTQDAREQLKLTLAHDALIPFLNSIEREKRLEVLAWGYRQLRLRSQAGEGGGKKPMPSEVVNGIITEANQLLGQRTALDMDRMRNALGPYQNPGMVRQAEAQGRLSRAEAQSLLDLMRLLDENQKNQLAPMQGPQNAPGRAPAPGKPPASGGGWFNWRSNPNERPSGPPPR